MDDRRSLWHILALVATLALSVVVAVVAVTRGEREQPAAGESPTPTPSASPSASPGGLQGEGPYAVYATGDHVFAYDVSSGTSTLLLGQLDADVVEPSSSQPGGGRIVAFPSREGVVWTVTRRGLERLGAIPSDVGSGFGDAVVSPDDRKLATAVSFPEAAIVLVNLQSGRPTVIERKSRGQYPREPLFPIAWSIGNTVLYEIPNCDCDAGSPGLYALDVSTGSSTRVSSTGSTIFLANSMVVSPSGQAVYYSTGRDLKCEREQGGPCPPFFLRRLAAGQRGSEVLRRDNDTPFYPDAISTDGRLLLVRRTLGERKGDRLELYNPEGKRQPALRGIPAGGATGLAILPRDIYVLRTDTGALVVVQDGRARTIVEGNGPTGGVIAYLGWLR